MGVGSERGDRIGTIAGLATVTLSLAAAIGGLVGIHCTPTSAVAPKHFQESSGNRR
jgi:hypothetical protein